MEAFDIDPDIRVAETLASRFYTEPTIFERSAGRIFARTWQYAGRVADVANVLPFTVLGEPLLLSRNDGAVRCLSNVCTHRGKLIVESPCRTNGLRCGYHGRRFDLTGKFLSMPEFESALNFPTERDDLRSIPSATWRDLVLISLEPAAPAGEFLHEVETITAELYDHEPEFAGAKHYDVNAHWALYCENYLEGFHVPFVHPGLNQAIDYGSYRTDLFRYSSLQTAYGDAGTFDGSVAAYYFFVFPNLMLNFYPWGISVNVVTPVAVDRTRVTYLTFVADETKRREGAGADLETVELEDQAVVESVQIGIRSRLYDRGRYSPTREQGTHHFHRLIAEFMTE